MPFFQDKFGGKIAGELDDLYYDDEDVYAGKQHLMLEALKPETHGDVANAARAEVAGKSGHGDDGDDRHREAANERGQRFRQQYAHNGLQVIAAHRLCRFNFTFGDFQQTALHDAGVHGDTGCGQGDDT